MHAKVSSRGLRFFAHDAACRECPLNGETPDHRLLKSAIAAAVRLAGWRAELEAVGPGGRWRADVLATSPDGRRRVAWEAQLAHQHDDDTRARTDRYADDGVEVVWVFDRPHFGDVPAVAVEVDQSNIRVTGPVARLTVGHCQPNSCVRYSDLPTRPPCPGHSRWEAVTFSLEAFVRVLCRGDMVLTALPAPDPASGGRRGGLKFAGFSVKRWWTSPSYLWRADAVRQAQAATDSAVAAVRVRMRQQREAETRRRLAEKARLEQEELQHEANRVALRERQRHLAPAVMRQITEQSATVPWALDGDPEHAMGVSILLGNRVVAVICPVARRITAEVAERLADVTVYVASDHEQQRLARRCRMGQNFVVVSEPSP